jgi:SAM-dependent methyltransferase
VTAWDATFYKTGYEGYEAAENFPSGEELEAYRTLLEERSAPQVDFIARHAGRDWLRVLELCSGNGRLLVGLAKQGLLESGLGVEISQSRVEFAQHWTEDLGLDEIDNVAADVLEYDAGGPYDVVAIITGAFGYFEAIRPDAPAELLRQAAASLRPGGLLVLEIYHLPVERDRMLALSGDRLRTWNELPEGDRFAFYLDDWTYDRDRSSVHHRKVFVGRDGSVDDGRVEILRYYGEEELRALLAEAGFVEEAVYDGFAGGEHVPGDRVSTTVHVARLAGGDTCAS